MPGKPSGSYRVAFPSHNPLGLAHDFGVTTTDRFEYLLCGYQTFALIILVARGKYFYNVLLLYTFVSVIDDMFW